MLELLKELILSNSSINIFEIFIRFFLSAIFGGIIGNERGKHGSQAGLRTHILVCLGSTMTSLVGLFSAEVLSYSGDPFRIAAQVVSGIGFLGAGMIIVRNGNVVTGLTTAAGMWTTSTIGIALGMGFYCGAFLLTIACVFTAAFLTRIERKRKNNIHLYMEIDNLSSSGRITDAVREMFKNDCLIEVLPPKSGAIGNLGIELTTSNINGFAERRANIEKIEGVIFSLLE